MRIQVFEDVTNCDGEASSDKTFNWGQCYEAKTKYTADDFTGKYFKISSASAFRTAGIAILGLASSQF